MLILIFWPSHPSSAKGLQFGLALFFMSTGLARWQAIGAVPGDGNVLPRNSKH